VDYLRESGDKTEALIFIFLGGVLTESEIKFIRLPAAELRSFSFLEPEAAYGRLNRRLGQRIRQCLKALSNGQTVYLEDQQPQGNER
ncbi:MAG: NUDIX hydrolase, partial [Chloroflexi bacterium]|nr:NUDIX hydrolase [Chloroflexota bacterium]